MDLSNELINRVSSLFLNGFNKEQIKFKLRNKEIANISIPDKQIDTIINKSLKQLGDINKARLDYIYKLCIDKRDYQTALKAWKEINDYGTEDKQIQVKFVK